MILYYISGDPAILHKKIKDENFDMVNISNYTLDELKEVASVCDIPTSGKSKVAWFIDCLFVFPE